MTAPTPATELNIDINKVCGIIAHARAYAGEMPTMDGETDEPADGGASDSILAEARSLVRDMNDEEQYALVALTWIGRGTYSADEWQDAVALARQEHNDHTDDYLLGMPLLADYLEDGLDAFDLSCDGDRT